jgi:ribosomal protein S27AE
VTGQPGTNTGHGHVWPRPDGAKVRCGGPGICPACSMDLAAHQPRFTCPRCNMVSYLPRDIAEGYCGNCHDWTGTRPGDRCVHGYPIVECPVLSCDPP